MGKALRTGFAAVLIGTAMVTVSATSSSAQTPDDGTRTIPAGGTTSIRPSALGADGLQQPELRPPRRRPQAMADNFNRARPEFTQGGFPRRPLDVPKVASSLIAASNPDVEVSVDGLTHRDQRLANGGNQFSLEPPDQALCVGNGFVVESTNGAIRVRSEATGAALTGVEDLNTFFGYPAAIDRTTGVFGPQRDRSGVPLRPGQQAVHRRHHHAPLGAGRRLHRAEHDRHGGVEHR